MVDKVVDASVLAAFLFQEPRAEEAAALLHDAVLFEPELLAFELASVARKKVRVHPELRVAILEALGIGLSIQARWVRVDHRAVVELALETGLSTYDASYLQLSRALDLPLVTFDEKLGAFASPTTGDAM